MGLLIFSTALIIALCLLDIRPLLSFVNDLKFYYRCNKGVFQGIVKKVVIYLRPFANWRFLVSYSIPFMITNGWAWIGVFLFGMGYRNWFTIASTSWMAFLWAPFTPEKLVTVPVAIWIHTKLFKRDPKTRVMLDNMYNEAKADWKRVKDRFFKTKD